MSHFISSTQDEVAFGETAGGVEVVREGDAEEAVEALDESSDNMQLEPSELKVRRKSSKLKTGRGKRLAGGKRLGRSEWMPLGLLRRMPSALKRESDRLRGDKNDQVKLKQTCYILFISRPILQVTLSADGMVLRLYLEKVKRWISEGRKAEAAALMQEMFKRPDEFWRADLLKWSQVAKRILRTDNTYKTAFLQPIYAFEELGLMMLSMAEQVEDREDRLSMIQQVIIKKVSLSSLTAFCLFQVATEAKKWVSRINKAEAARNKYLKKIPRTLIRCGELLLEEGDVKGLNSLFDGWSPNSRNEDCEFPLLVLRSVATMLERKGRDEGDSLSMSGLSFTSLASTSRASSGGRGDAVMTHMTRAMLGPRGAEVAWTARLVAWYVLEERTADEVLELLIKYRDAHLDTVACHTPLLEFLEREYCEEVELRVKHLKVAADQFPWEPHVLQLCKLQGLKENESDEESINTEPEDNGSVLTDQDEEVERGDIEGELPGVNISAYDSGVDGVDGPRTEDAVKEDDATARKIDILQRLLLFLEYDINSRCRDAWALLVEKLRSLVLAGKSESVEQAWRQYERDFWWDQNYSGLQGEDASLVRDKGSVAVILAGSSSTSFLKAVDELERRRGAGMTGVTAMLNELEAFSSKNLQPCLRVTKKQRVDQRFLVNEWKVIEDLSRFKYSATARKNPEFPNC